VAEPPEMPLVLLRLFQRQVEAQCRYMWTAYTQVREALEQLDDPDRKPPWLDMWAPMQNLLTATANVSKVLWGQGGSREAERAALRRSIGVQDDSPLRWTTLRNHFEHIDERIDRWWAESINHNYLDGNIAPEGWIRAQAAEIDIFRTYDSETGVVLFWGDRVNIHEVMREVDRIYPVLLAESQEPHWET
jgi:hypothetical protein